MNRHTFRKMTAISLIFISLLSQTMVTPARVAPSRIRQSGIIQNENGPAERVFDGGRLFLLANGTGRQLLSIVLQDKNGSLVVIDGGWASDTAHLTRIITQNGGHVSGWFITHPHSDHVGAITRILNDPESPITIDHVYYSLADQSWYEAHENFRSGDVMHFREALSTLPAERLHGDIHKGQEIQIGDIRVTVMNDPYLLDATPVNNSSVCYKFFMDGISLMVLGDLGPEGGALFLSEHTPQELQSDIVQMSHHGQYGVAKDVYAAINPRICLWPTPSWLWDNDGGDGKDSGPWYTLETRGWMDELGVPTHYSTKDGDWIIR